MRVQAAIVEPQTEYEFRAYVEFVDDQALAGMGISELLQIVPAESTERFVFLVDEQTLSHRDRPILVVNLYDWAEDIPDQRKGPLYGTSFRVVPSEMWAVQNNLALANMDWEEFAADVDNDGILRGSK